MVSTSVVLVGAGMLGIAWLADWLPIRMESPETGELADAGFDEENFPGLPTSRLSESPNTAIDESVEEPPADPLIFSGQSEPGTRPPGLAASPSRPDWTLDSLPQPPVVSDRNVSDASGSGEMPTRFPAVDSDQPPEFLPADFSVAENQADAPASAAVFDLVEHDSDDGPAIVNAVIPEFQSDSAQSLPQSRTFPAQVAYFEDAAATPVEEPAVVPSADATVSSLPVSPSPNMNVDLIEIDALLKAGDYVNAHRQLSTLYWNQPELHPAIMERLEGNAELIYFRPQPHFLEPYTVQSGDLLQRIAPRYRINWEYLAGLNNVDPRRVRVGQRLKVIKGPFSAFVDLSDFTLTIHCHGFFVKQFPIGIGKDGATPTGRFSVLDRVPNPQYTDPDGRVMAGDDPNNPLGDYWLDLGDSYGIHGTIEPDSIGKAASRGCVRMHNKDVAQVYNFLVRGSEVAIRP